MSDSDETVSPDSDDTLPPDDKCGSPDLFADTHSGLNETNNKTGRLSLNKSRSKTHEISDSDSEDKDDSSLLHKQISDNRDGCKSKDQVSSASNHTNVKISNSQNGLKGKSTVSSHGSAKKYSEKKKFMDEFLTMTDSDSENEYEKNKRKLQALKDETKTVQKYTKEHDMCKGRGKDVVSDADAVNTSEQKKDIGRTHFSQKPHKKDYSTPFKGDVEARSQDFQSFVKTKDQEVIKKPSPGQKRHRSPVPQELRKAVTEILSNYDANNSAKKKKTPCQYGSKCYRKNPSHFEEYSHPEDEDLLTPPKKKAKLDTSSAAKVKDKTDSKSRSKVRPESPSCSKVKDEKPSTSGVRSRSPTVSVSKPRTHLPDSDCKVVQKPSLSCTNPTTSQEKFDLAQPYSFFLTKVTGISNKYNAKLVMDIKDILSEEMGTLKASCQFNYMFDIQWLMKQYPSRDRSKPLLIVHGEHGSSMAALQAQAMQYSNIRFCQAKLEMMYGTHHTKMMLLLYEEGIRVVIHTSNLIEQDWYQKTQGMWISPVFAKLGEAGRDRGDSPTHFKRELIDYLQAYKAYQLKEWIDHIASHDMSTARVIIIGSVPGRHKDAAMSSWGHMKLRKALTQHGPSQATVKAWPVIGQFSSIGSMGPNKENWLCGEWLQSLAAVKSCGGLQTNIRLQLIFPSRHNVRLSLEGYPAGGSIPYSASTAKKQPFLHDYFHIWKSEGRGRSRAMPHIKTFARPMQDGSKAAWFLVTSANLSKAAWGAHEKKGTQLMIRSYEIGVLFLPKFFGEGEMFPLTSDADSGATTNQFVLPYDLPTTAYSKTDRPWMWDIPYMDLPDTNGNVWCPFSK